VIAAVLRWALPAMGLLSMGVALLGAPSRGTPPLASLFQRAEARVLSVELRDVTPPGGQRRVEIRIELAWPPGGEGRALLGAADRLPLPAEDVIAAHPPGSTLRVRVSQGQPWADVTDAFALGWTLFVALLGAALTTLGAFFHRALR
jgi:hypothetical protein